MRTAVRTVSVSPAARMPLPSTSPMSSAHAPIVQNEHVVEVAAHELGLRRGGVDDADLDAVDLRHPMDEVLLQRARDVPLGVVQPCVVERLGEAVADAASELDLE